MIILTNCKPYLEAMGIYLEQVGAVDLLSSKLAERLTLDGWEYDFYESKLIIYTNETEVDMSDFGGVVNR
jgi:hypothetical protein